MTNKEAIEELKKVDTLDMPARLCEAHYMSIKALEFRDDVLDKIEKEISNLKGTFPSEYYLKIIDKYRESEE